MRQEWRDARLSERMAEARRLATESRMDELRDLVTDLRMRSGALSPDLEVFLATQLAVGQYSGDHPGAARGELDLVRPLVPNASVLSQAQFHAIAGAVAFRLENAEVAIAETVQALAAIDGSQAPSPELATVAGACALNLAHTQLFLLAAETAERAIEIARQVDAPVATFLLQAGYANVCWAMRLQHLGRDTDSREQWQSAAEHLAAAFEDVDQLPLLYQAHGLSERAYAAAQLGDIETARTLLREAQEVPVRPLTPDIRKVLAHAEGAVLLAEGKVPEAREVLTAYWAQIEERNLPPWTEDAAWLLGRVAEADGDPQEALRWYREVHERYGRAQYEVWLSRATTARLRVEQEALLRRTRQLESDALSDPLTGVANRRAFDANLPRLISTAQATGMPLTLAIVDVDRFKRVNDDYGHQVGDEVLRQVGRILREHTREADRCARYGGDEFVLVLPSREPEATAAVRRIGAAISDHDWSTVAPGLEVSVTNGVAELGFADTATTLFWTADQHLLTAKRSRPAMPGDPELPPAASPIFEPRSGLAGS